MQRLTPILGAVLLLTGTLHAATANAAQHQRMKMSEAECESAWNSANPSQGATITREQAKGYITDFKAANPDNDATIDRAEFMSACGKGLVKHQATTGAGSGSSGTSKTSPEKQHSPSK